jgi:ATP-dependent DNA ligase
VEDVLRDRSLLVVGLVLAGAPTTVDNFREFGFEHDLMSVSVLYVLGPGNNEAAIAIDVSPRKRSGACTLISRNGNAFRRFDDLRLDLAKRLPDGTVLDGEICCLDDRGRPQFCELMRRNPDCHFYAFDALKIGDEDIRGLPLVERKARLRKLIRRGRSRLLYVDHIGHHGSDLFAKACELDLEGIVAKRKVSFYCAN